MLAGARWAESLVGSGPRAGPGRPQQEPVSRPSFELADRISAGAIRAIWVWPASPSAVGDHVPGRRRVARPAGGHEQLVLGDRHTGAG
jgi:hypothetical protein